MVYLKQAQLLSLIVTMSKKAFSTRTFTRRDCLKLGVLMAGTPLLGAPADQPNSAALRRRSAGAEGFAGTVRDRLWISVTYGDTGMTPAESALYLGVPNIILAGAANGKTMDRRLALSLSSFARVIWPVLEFQQFNDQVRPLLAAFPNFSGVLLDCGKDAILAAINPLSQAVGHKNLWASFASKSFDSLAHSESLQSVSCVLVWLGVTEKDDKLLARAANEFPAAQIMIGLSLEEDGDSHASDRLRAQCEFALKALHNNQISGLVFGTGEGIAGGSAQERQAQKWIEKVGAQRISHAAIEL